VNQFLDTSGSCVEADGAADSEVLPLAAGGLAHVQGMAVGPLEDGGRVRLAGKPLAQGVPVAMDAIVLKMAAQDLREPLGQHGHEQGAVDPCSLVVEDGVQVELRL
jgi:hypothetical protein